MSSPFAARYGGRCPACGHGIIPDDLVRYTEDDELVHDECAHIVRKVPVVRPMCPDCFTELPVTGPCGNCA